MQSSSTLKTKDNCLDEIEALNRCHKDHPIKDLFGGCKEKNEELDKCLAIEFLKVQKESMYKAKLAKKHREETKEIP